MAAFILLSNTQQDATNDGSPLRVWNRMSITGFRSGSVFKIECRLASEFSLMGIAGICEVRHIVLSNQAETVVDSVRSAT